MAKQEKLILKHNAIVRMKENAEDVVELELPIFGIIDAKDGKTTHVVASSKFDLVRSDGKIVTVQVNAWYK